MKAKNRQSIMHRAALNDDSELQQLAHSIETPPYTSYYHNIIMTGEESNLLENAACSIFSTYEPPKTI